MAFRGVNFRAACELVEAIVGTSKVATVKKTWETGSEKARERMAALWGRAGPLTGDDPGSRYWLNRCKVNDVVLPPPEAVRFNPEALVFGDGTDEKRFCPALVTRFVAPDLSRAVLHLTYVNLFGGKAEVPKVKMFVPGIQIPDGGAVRLAPPAKVMGVCEGVETGASIARVEGFPVWPTLSAVALAKFVPPPECDKLFIFSDRDSYFTGGMCAYTLAHRLSLIGRIQVEIRMNDIGWGEHRDRGDKSDFNDTIEQDLERRERAEENRRRRSV